MPEIPILGGLRQKDYCEFKARLGYTMSLIKPSLSYRIKPFLKQTTLNRFKKNP